MTNPFVVLAFFLLKPPVAWTGDVDRAVYQAHPAKIDPWALTRAVVIVDVMAPLAPKPHLLNVPHMGNHHLNSHEDQAVLSARTPAAAVHLSLVAIPTS